jgi:hypothetical protein
MTFSEFKRLRAQGAVVAGISDFDSASLLKYLPKRYQYANAFWFWICVLTIPGFILLSIFYLWWFGLMLLIVVTPAIYKANRRSASQFVLEYAEADEQFFNALVSENLLVFKSTTNDTRKSD